MKKLLLNALILCALVGCSTELNAGIVGLGTYGTSFAQNGPWDGFTNGSTIQIGGATFTMDNILPDGILNEISSGNGGLGINAALTTDNASQFDVGESFTLAMNYESSLTGMDFGGLGTTTSISDQFQISSATLGTFTFNDKDASDVFTGVDSNLLDFSNILIPAFEEIKFEFTGGVAGATAYIEGIQFSVAAIPEPTSFLMFGAVMSGLGFRRRR